jgi:hypothetical protein
LIDFLERAPFRAWQAIPPVILVGAAILHLLIVSDFRFRRGREIVGSIRTSAQTGNCDQQQE